MFRLLRGYFLTRTSLISNRDRNVARQAPLHRTQTIAALVDIPKARAKNRDVVSPVAVEIARNRNIAVCAELKHPLIIDAEDGG